MTAADQGPLDPAAVAALYERYADELRRFIAGVLHDATLAQDVVQTAFAKLVEQGGQTRSESRKSWLFRVAFHEALDARRRLGRQDFALRRAAEKGEFDESTLDSASAGLVRQESIEAVRRALTELPPEQQEIVRLRIYEERTFAEIARLLEIPLGTALGRMHLAIKKLRARLPDAARPEP